MELSSQMAPLLKEVTCLLSAVEQGDPHAAAQLLPLVYAELRQLAAQKLAQEKPGQTLQATALVHEAYVRLVGGGRGPAMDRTRTLPGRRGRGHAPHPRRDRPPQGVAQAGRGQGAGRAPGRRPGRRPLFLHCASIT
jgi:hypothetical protein